MGLEVNKEIQYTLPEIDQILNLFQELVTPICVCMCMCVCECVCVCVCVCVCSWFSFALRYGIISLVFVNLKDIPFRFNSKTIKFLMISRLIVFELVILELSMFKFCGIYRNLKNQLFKFFWYRKCWIDEIRLTFNGLCFCMMLSLGGNVNFSILIFGSSSFFIFV